MQTRVMTSEDRLLIEKWVLEAHRSGEIWASGWNEEKTRSSLLDSRVWVIGIENRVDGFLIAREPGAAWEIDLVAVRPECRRQGILRSLVLGLEKDALRLESEKGLRGPRLIWLEVHELNHPAITAYLSLGFQSTGRRATYYRDGGAAILMAKAFGPNEDRVE